MCTNLHYRFLSMATQYCFKNRQCETITKSFCSNHNNKTIKQMSARNAVRKCLSPNKIGVFKMSTLSSDDKSAAQKEEGFQKTIESNEKIIRTLDLKENEGFWVFGYGSLVWKVNFEYRETKIGTIDGYNRRFWQESTDHRGTHEEPGRVVTLITGTYDDKLWGKAYFIPPEQMKQTLETLNFREKGGYSLTKVPFTPRMNKHSTAEKIIPVLLYIAIQGNVNYVGEEPLDKLAIRIAKSVGPSGSNVEYLENLAKFLEDNDIVTEDDKKHTVALRDHVTDLLRNNRQINT